MIKIRTRLPTGSIIYALALPEAMSLLTGDLTPNLTLSCVLPDKHEQQ